MKFTDTHTHLYDPLYDQDIDQVVERALRFGVHRMMLPGVESTEHQSMVDLAARYPDVLFPMIGVHPTNISKENIDQELSSVRDWLAGSRFIAIGEIGIDLYWDKTTLDVQLEAFTAQLDMAIEYRLPVSIHSRDAFDEVFDVLSRDKYSALKGILHCFSGTKEQAEKIISIGYMLGIGGAVTYKNNPLKDILKEIGISHIVLETDAPYLAPVPLRGKRNESSYVPDIAAFIADYVGVSMEELSRISEENVDKVFGRV